MGLFKKKKTESLSPDFSKNPIVLEFLESVKKEEIKNYVFFQDALCYNYKVDGIYTNYGNEIYYKERGYQDIDKSNLNALNSQICEMLSSLYNVKEVKKIPWAVNYTRYKYDSAYGRNIPAKTLKGEFYEIIYRENELISW